MDDARITLRSYRLAFEMERRLHRVDRFRIPVPYGVPLTGLAYAAGLAIAVLCLRSAPLIGALVAELPLPIRLVLLPGLGAHLLSRTRADGRLAHEALAARMTRRLSPRRLVGLQPAPGNGVDDFGVLALVGDERAPMYGSGTVEGPATVRLRQPARVVVHGRCVRLRQLEDRPMTRARDLELDSGQRLVIE